MGASVGDDGNITYLSDLLDSFFTRIEILEGDFTDYQDVEDVANTIMACLCVVCAGLAAGLTMGLLSLDSTKLEIKQMTGTEEERAAASVLLPIIKRHHLLLVTLLLFNSIANEALPIFLGALMPNYLAVFVSVSLILIFGEILPSAFFTGPQQLMTAAKMAGFVWGLMALFSPISLPIAKLLDLGFGTDEDRDNRISRADLEALFILQGRGNEEEVEAGTSRYQSIESTAHESLSSSTSSSSSSPSQPHQPQVQQEGLHQYEVSILTGILSLSRTSVGDCMIPLDRVFALEASERPTPELLLEVLASGYSRIPLFRRAQGTGSGPASNQSSPSVSAAAAVAAYAATTATISTAQQQQVPSHSIVWLGYLLTKSLIAPDALPSTLGQLVDSPAVREPLFVRPSLGLLEMLALFRQGRSHMALVTLSPMAALANMRMKEACSGDTAILGLVTLEDVIERILQSDIVDETDVVDQELLPRKGLLQGGAPTVMFHGFHRGRGTSGLTGVGPEIPLQRSGSRESRDRDGSFRLIPLQHSMSRESRDGSGSGRGVVRSRPSNRASREVVPLEQETLLPPPQQTARLDWLGI